MSYRLPVVVACLLATSSVAQGVESPVHHYTHGTSFSLLSGGAVLGAVGTNGSIGILSGRGTLLQFSLGIDARISISGFLLDPSIGIAYGSGPGAVAAAITPGMGLGYAFGLTSHLALSPMVRGWFYIFTIGGLALATVTAELPATIFLGRNGFMEPYVGAGLAILSGSPVFAASVGYRLGVTF